MRAVLLSHNSASAISAVRSSEGVAQLVLKRAIYQVRKSMETCGVSGKQVAPAQSWEEHFQAQRAVNAPAFISESSETVLERPIVHLAGHL